MEPNAPLAYAPGMELHLPIMSNLGKHGGRLEIDIEREREGTIPPNWTDLVQNSSQIVAP